MSERTRTLLAVALLLVATAVLLHVGVQVPLQRLDVPYQFSDDALDKLVQIKNVAETGWLFHNERLGWPFGFDRLDFPRFDSLNYAIMGPIAAMTGEAGVAMNAYFLAGYPLIALAAFFTFWTLGMSRPVAVVCALAYAFLPYHALRGVRHLTNGAYFLVPPAVLVATWAARGRLEWRRSRRRVVFALLVAVLIPLQTPYNGVFFAAVCVAAAALAYARRLDPRALVPALALVVATAGSFAVEQLPGWLYRHADPGLAFSGHRGGYEAELYAMRLNQVLLPTDHHPVEAIARAKRDFDIALHADAPSWANNQYLGVLGVLGFFALLWALARASAAEDGASREARSDELATNTRVMAYFAVLAVLLAVSTGIGTIIAHGLVPEIRAYNRILPFFALFCMAGAGWAFDAATRRLHVLARAAALCAIAAAGAVEVVQHPFPERAATIRDHDRERDYFQLVERSLGPGAALFEQPAVWYPEHPPVNRMGDYEAFKPFLLTSTLKVSYGSSRGRPGYHWNRTVADLPVPERVDRVAGAGFDAILVDAWSYPDATSRAQDLDALADAITTRPIVSDDRRWWTFPLRDCCPGRVAFTVPQAGAGFPIAAGAGPVRFSKGGLGGLYEIGAWWDAESWGSWSLGDNARLRMRVDAPAQRPLELDAVFRMVTSERLHARSVRVFANDVAIGTATYSRGDGDRTFHATIPAAVVGRGGEIELRFVVDRVVSPRAAGLGDDERPLGIGLVSISLGRAVTGADR